MEFSIYYVITAVLAYLLGNVQSAVLLSRWKYHDDVRNHGSGNAGSTNMVRVFGLKPGLITFVGDFAKGILGVLIGRWIAGEMGGYIAALFVVLGHDFPVFYKFKGGKGVASTYGIIWMMNPLYGAIILVAVTGLLVWTKTIAIVSMICMTFYVALTVIFDWGNTPLVILAVILWALMIIRHADNIRRIIRKEEKKLFTGKKEENKLDNSNSL